MSTTNHLPMKLQLYYLAFVTVIAPLSAISQNCNFVLKDGSKFVSTAYSWTNPNLYDPKFQKLPDDKKDELISKYNSEVSSGKIPPASTYPLTFNVKKTSLAQGGDEYKLTVNVGGIDYSSYMICKNDTLTSYRNKDVVYVPDGKGGSLGFTIQGPQKLPLSLKVGDKLPSYEDISVLYPQNFNTTQKVYVTENYGSAGTALVEYQVAAKQTFALSSLALHFMFAEVTAEENIIISGEPYKAFVIESQSWNKGKMDVSFTTAYSDVNEWAKKGIDKMQANYDKMMKRKQYTNELGYMVTYQRLWFVPSIGIVKTESFDNFGGIAGGSDTTAIE